MTIAFLGRPTYMETDLLSRLALWHLNYAS